MANTVTSPNMNLVVPVPSVDPGPDWAQQIYACLYTNIDQHNHSAGQGVQIQPSGINISSDLTFNNNNAVALKTSSYQDQGSSLASSVLGAVYMAGGNLYFNAGADGYAVQITAGHSVNGSAGTITGLPSGTASAAYAAGTFVFQSATSTAANIDGGSYLIRASSTQNAVTLSVPSSLSAGYGLSLPAALPGSSLPLILSSVGNITTGQITAAQITSHTITATQIANTTITATQIANTTITATQIANTTITATQIANTTITAAQVYYGIGFSTSSDTFTTTSTSYTPVVDSISSPLSAAVTTKGGTVLLTIQPDGNGTNPAFMGLVNAGGASMSGFIQIKNGSNVIAQFVIEPNADGLTSVSESLIPTFTFLDNSVGGTPGTYAYTIQAKVSGSGSPELFLEYILLCAVEIL